jgi:hypothetical protein
MKKHSYNVPFAPAREGFVPGRMKSYRGGAGVHTYKVAE